jgi:hypothetical protein
LAAINADIPAEVARTSLPSKPADVGGFPQSGRGAATIVVAVDAGAFAAAISGAPALVTFILLILAVGMTGTALMAAFVRGMLLIEARHSRRSGGQLPLPAAGRPKAEVLWSRGREHRTGAARSEELSCMNPPTLGRCQCVGS